MVAKLLQFDDIAYPEELIVKLQGTDKLTAFRNKISVPIDHIESIKVIELGNIQDEHHGLVEVAGVGAAGSLGRRSKVGSRHSMVWNRGKEKKAVKGKAVAITLINERYTELVLEVNDIESEKVVKVLLEMLHEASISRSRY
mmetsp:Transcript_3270/g.5021  ORF Transcript_3270/g.5021 Transcript_3270/m.5021 type:complete len:142 (-) Transcript_3270:205-630(-)|eukprot:CAMPEP_0201723532 /NCGR_PEP_ID=MMETSP0593-20130828/7563_1 /ASSEMBLY_ACC=CAM_ASM_000672 /TAXON_ID=267983 /ORGANISM="Skeletonema japonicum, Strain CCMP2506" /LENGTH=141 /DNA_ID=CAMNT_0048214657 /DNA_START=61 /DNA_END=486 /DNA_ORIENTATION=+